MATPFSVDPYMCYVALIPRAGSEPTVGVLLQGPNFPVILSVLHAFEPAAIGQLYTGILCQPYEVIRLKVHYLNKGHDFIIFEVTDHIQRETAPADITVTSTPKGEPYVMIGYSSCQRVDSGYGWKMSWTSTPGYLTTDLLDFCIVGTGSGSSPGDSGGPLFSRVTNKVIGINIAVSNLHPGWTDVECARARVSSQGNLKPLWLCEVVMSVLCGGDQYFQPGGLAYYASASSKCTSQPTSDMKSHYAVRREQHLFTESRSQGVQSTALTDLFDANLLDPYK